MDYGGERKGSEVRVEWESEEKLLKFRNKSCCVSLMAVTALQHAILCSANAGRWVITVCRVVCAACKHTCCGNKDIPTATEEEGYTYTVKNGVF